MNNNAKLYYVHDPMCSWCYGFKPVLNLLTHKLNGLLEIHYILGGLAKDTSEIMPKIMQDNIKSNWKNIEKSIPDIKFNYQFWKKCTPKRSTYAACRAVISAKKQQPNFELQMISAIQDAYYLNAMNPSNYNVLYELSAQCGMNKKQFILDIHCDEVNNELMQQISKCRKLGADTFPSLFLLLDKSYYPIVLDYNNADIMFEHIKSCINYEL